MVKVFVRERERENLSGMYARSEGPWETIKEYFVSKEDRNKFLTDDDVAGICIPAAFEKVKDLPEWCKTPSDIEEAAEDGDPAAVEWFQAYDAEHNNFKKITLQTCDEEPPLDAIQIQSLEVFLREEN